MRIKNIVFSGFAAAMFASVCGVVDAATLNLASKSYVDEALATKQNALTAGDGIDITDNVVKSTIDTSRFVLKGEIPVLSDFATDDELAAVKKALQEEIAAKQAAGDYATAAELKSLSSAVEALQAGGADKTVLESLKKTVDTISSDYAKKTELTDTEARLQAQIEKIVVPSLEGYAKLTDVPSLDGYAKTSDIETVYATKSELGNYAKVADLQDKADASALEGLVDTQQLTKVQEALQVAIAEKQEKGDYASAADLKSLQDAVSGLQSSGVDKTLVENLKTTVETISADYAKKTDLTAAEEKLQAAIDAIVVPSLEGYAKTADVADVYATKASLSDYATTTALAGKADKSELNGLVTSAQLTTLRSELVAEIAKKQAAGDYVGADALKTVSDSLAELKNDSYTKKEVDDKIATAISGGEIDLSDYATTSALEALQALVSGNTNEITALKNAGYQTSDDVQGAITTATADLATKGELNTALTSYTKTADLADVAKTGSYNDLKDQPIIPSIEGLATSKQLEDLQSALETEISKKQDAGQYLVAADLTTLNNAVSALQSGKADASTVTILQETVSKLGETYATDSELLSAIDGVKDLIAAIKVPTKTSELENDSGYITENELDGYAKSADVADVYATKASLSDYATTTALAGKADKSELNGLVTSAQLTTLRSELVAEIAKKQAAGDYVGADALKTVSDSLAELKNDSYTKKEVDDKIATAISGGEIDLSGYATTSALEALQALVNGKQDKLTAGAGITITDNTISANVDTSGFVPIPKLPTEFGEWFLTYNVDMNGVPEGYTWTNSEDLNGGVEDW